MADPLTLDKMRAAPVVEIPVLSKLKRKRTNSSSDALPQRTQQDKKPRPTEVATQFPPSTISRPPSKLDTKHAFTQATTTSPSLARTSHLDAAAPENISSPLIDSPHTINSSTTLQQTPTTMANGEDIPMLDNEQYSARGDLTKLQEVIENEFNVQILMKHNELRLIEQEMAKCQIALEQLRRVELRPYPGNHQFSNAVSSGTGPSIVPPSGYTQPAYSPPHGVTDGPYTRHYHQWLLQDPLFDSGPLHNPLYTDSMAHMAGRSTRNSGSTRKSISKPFTFPSRPNDTLQSIPNYPAPPAKDKSAPLVLKRSTDNQFVKLICNNCLRGNFSSIQGFLNHCRIAHKVDYKSHDAAAIDCGRTLEEHEVANLPAEPAHPTPSHKPSLSRISTTTTTTTTSTPFRNLVHPLNTTAGAAVPLSNPKKRARTPRAAIPSLAARAAPQSDATFTASPQVPRLSAQFAKYQLGGDLAAAVAGAKQKVDLDLDDDMLSPDASEQTSPLDNSLESVAGRSAMTIPGARPPSRKGIRPPTQRQPKPSPLTPAPYDGTAVKQEGSAEMPESPPYPLSSSAAHFSPHTADSNPGLVSDHEDDDHGSASEEEAPHAEMPRPFGVPGRTCADNVDVEVAEDDDHVGSGVIIRRNGLYADETSLRGAGSPSRKLGLGKRGV